PECRHWLCRSARPGLYRLLWTGGLYLRLAIVRKVRPALAQLVGAAGGRVDQHCVRAAARLALVAALRRLSGHRHAWFRAGVRPTGVYPGPGVDPGPRHAARHYRRLEWPDQFGPAPLFRSFVNQCHALLLCTVDLARDCAHYYFPVEPI